MREGLNDWRRTGYGGPCPPIGRQRYFHELYALDVVLRDLGTPAKAALEKAMRGYVLAQTDLVGTYWRKWVQVPADSCLARCKSPDVV